MPKDRMQAMKAISVGTELAFSVIAGGFIGYFIGKRFGETGAAIGLSVGILLGFIGGMYDIIKRFW
ncbi:MAG: AtpZ/AtpI family protein [Methanocellales archaeon]|nr:AtpZ/AtpI family protein [Methanocellales archaeon]MDI6902489.1 AtpZ/AtpI family protein [Methanocellales archaeon]